jgi:FeS assembly SUF system protein
VSDQPLHLNVLPNSGKVEQLRSEMASEPITPRTDSIDESHPLVAKVIEVIRGVFDPEIPVNIYELGLIYSVDVNDKNDVHVKMTLTAPACPVAGTLPRDVENRINAIPEVNNATVEVVWDPPWSKERMSEAALLELGLL